MTLLQWQNTSLIFILCSSSGPDSTEFVWHPPLCVCVCVCVCVCCVGRLSSVGLECCNGVKTSRTLLVVGLSLSDGSFGVISLGKKLTHICLSRLRSINEYLASAGGAKTTGCSICLWGPGGTLGAYTTVGVTVGAPVSTWPSSRKLSVLAQRSLLSAQGAQPLGWGCDL